MPDAKELLFKIMRLSGLCYLLRKCLWRNKVAIVVYHDPKPEVLDAHLAYLKKISTVISMSEIWSATHHGPLAVITLDDGHAGNVALGEVFQKHQVRPTHFLCTGIIRAGAGYWWRGLDADEAQALKKVTNNERKAILSQLGFDETRPVMPRQALSCDEIRSMAAWADMGAHTRFHPILTQCDFADCENEISLSRDELFPLTGVQLRDFAYPNGDCSDREVNLIKQAGFRSARTCDPGWNTPQSDRYRLKGICVGDEASVDKFAVQLTGVPALLRDLIRTLNRYVVDFDNTGKNMILDKIRKPDRVDQARARQGIAVVIGQLGRGGSERQLYMFLARCDFNRWAPVLYVSGELGVWKEPIEKLGVPVVLLQGGRLAKMKQFRAACIAQGAKYFFSWSSYTNAFGLALTGLGVRRIGSFRNASFSDLPTRFRSLWSLLSVAGVSTVVCNSRETQSQLAPRSSSKKQFIYVPNGVEDFTPEELWTWRTQWRRRLNLSDEAILILGVGRLVPQKNFDRFIDVIAAVDQRVPVQAVIAGRDDGCLTDLQNKVARLGLQDKVQFIGQVSDARELMCAADIFLLCSDYEGMPNVLLEAMASGTACVATNVNSVGDLIEHGSSGFVEEKSVEALSQRVIQLALDAELRRLIGANARTVMERNRPEEVSRRLWKLCEQVECATPAEREITTSSRSVGVKHRS